MLSVVLLVAIVVGLATPGRAEAMDPMTIMAIAGAAAVVVIIVVFLVVANMHDAQRSAATPQYVACAESDTAPRTCWALPSGPAVPFADEAPTLMQASDVPGLVAAATPQS